MEVSKLEKYYKFVGAQSRTDSELEQGLNFKVADFRFTSTKRHGLHSLCSEV